MTAPAKIVVSELRRLIDQGLSTAEIAARFGVQSPAVCRACHTHGFPLPQGKGKAAGRYPPEPTRADDERDLDCIRSIVAGEGYHAVAARLRISNTYIQKIVREVEAADIAESGEPVRSVARHYANPRRRRP